MKIAQLLLLILAFLIIDPVKAAVLIEPVLGFNAASKIDVVDGNAAASGGMGLGYGGRLGYQNLGFQLGLDYLKSSIDMDDSDFKKNINSSEWAAFVGFEFPVLLRVYAGYIFSATGDTKSSGGDVKFSDGSGMKVGIGTTLLPFLDLNLEYRSGAYGTTKVGGADIDSKTNFSAYMLSLSLPITI